MPRHNWDTWAFQDGLLRQIDNKERYRAEHIDRIRRRQPNGTARMRASLTGEIAAIEALLGGSDTPRPEDMVKKIEDKLNQEPPKKNVEFVDSYQNGWRQGLREILGSVKPYLDPVD